MYTMTIWSLADDGGDIAGETKREEGGFPLRLDSVASQVGRKGEKKKIKADDNSFGNGVPILN